MGAKPRSFPGIARAGTPTLWVVARRILAAPVAVLAFLLIAPARLNSEPATTTTRPNARATTSTTFGIVPPDSAMNPLRLYPRLPGAKYEDSVSAPDRDRVDRDG